jgi:hypothetical protein
MIIGSLVVLVLTIVPWPVMALVRRHYGKPLTLTAQQRRLRLVARLVCVLYRIFRRIHRLLYDGRKETLEF